MFDYGTGSYPFPPQGLQLNMRLSDNQPPLKSPCFWSASKVYCEHVGVYLQLAGVKGEINIWYNLTKKTKGAIRIFFTYKSIIKRLNQIHFLNYGG